MASHARPGPSPSGRYPRGQTLVEFALILPIFLFALFGLLDMGRFVYMNSTLSQAAREGARLASVEARWMGSTDPSCNQVGGPVCPANLAALRADVLAAANRMMTPFGTISAAKLYTKCDTTAPTGKWTDQTCTTSSGLASVRVELAFQPITPFIGQMFPNITSSAAATMAVN
jgi:Flp pilus assembly protein TadG